MASYSRLNPTVETANGEEWPHGAPAMVQQETEYVPAHHKDVHTAGHTGAFVSVNSSNSDSLKPQLRPSLWSFGKRTNSGFSIASAPWEHALSEKHLRSAPSTSETTRYFDRRRQTRRVFIDGLIVWLGTLTICAALAGTIYGFSTIVTGLSQTQKYAYNAIVTGLSITLGLAFSAQFKNFASMMRWRFLASHYRSLKEFEDVLGCDSYRTTVGILLHHWRNGTWSPSKTQLLAAFWLLVFIAFNVFAALIGLTYSIDVSTDFVYVQHGDISVATLKYIANTVQANNGRDYPSFYQQASANLWGSLGQTISWYNTSIDDVTGYTGGAIYYNSPQDLFWYRFIDRATDSASTSNVVSTRIVTSKAVCKEYNVTYGGYAGLNTNNASLQNDLEWTDEYGNAFYESFTPAATGETTWAAFNVSNCGPRCGQILALQSANNLTEARPKPGEVTTPVPRLWACNNTVSQVSNYNSSTEGFDNPDALLLPDKQAQILAGSVGLTGIRTTGSHLQFTSYHGDTYLNPQGEYTTAESMAAVIMAFTASAISGMDNFGGPRFNTTGARSPSPAQVVNVKWNYAGAIIGGIPVVQFLMLIAVVWFSGKAIMLEPSFLTTAHLLQPVLDKIGEAGSGCLMSADELSDRLGPNFRIAYGVRPKPDDPGHHDDTFVRHVGIIDYREGFGKVTKGKMPQGRYD